MHRLSLLLCLVIVTSACTPAPDPTPERLPTRAIAPFATPYKITAEDYYQEGLIRQEAGDVERALQSFTWAIEQAPGMTKAHVARGTVYLAQGEMEMAMEDVDTALALDAENATAYALQGEVFRRQGRIHSALEALNQALALDPQLAADTFRSRWLAALALHDADRLGILSREYAYAHPNDTLRHYYVAWASLELGTPHTAINTLVEQIESVPNAPAVFWFALAHAYARNKAWAEAAASYEAVLVLIQSGDNSLSLHTDQPLVDVFGGLGIAYLRAGRCADAESMLEYALAIGAPTSRYGSALAQSRACQTPTPTGTPQGGLPRPPAPASATTTPQEP